MFKQISGSIGSIFASLCCLGFAPVLAALSAAGLGFVISDAILIPLLALFLGIALWGMKGSQKRHGKTAPLLCRSGWCCRGPGWRIHLGHSIAA
ncbi:MAG: MerC domain-containing protein [Devosiaceae bacterium]|nr:MerC domain-containing protein [Devosiaceae bacterium]